MIEIKNVSKTYSFGEVKVKALQDVSVKIKQGEFVSITGPSGSGKSTLMHIMGLLDTPDSGKYILDAKNVSNLSEKKLASLRSQKLGFVFQMFNLLPRMNALQNTSLPLIYTPKSKRENCLDPQEILNKVGLAGRTKHSPAKLSGGEQQRVAIARALIKKPKILLADEPTGNLDSASADEIMKILKELNLSGITVIMVTHEKSRAEEADRIIEMLDGRIVEDKKRKKHKKTYPSLEDNNFLSKRKIINFYKIKNYFLQAFKGLLANKSRSLLSVLGVLIGVSAVIAMLALGSGAREDISSRLAAMGANRLSVRPTSRRHVASSHNIPRFSPEDARAMDSIRFVEYVDPRVRGNVSTIYLNRSHDTSVEGVSESYQYLEIAPERGRFFTEEENLSRERVAVIGKTVRENLFPNENPIGAEIRIDRINFRVIGILPERGASGWRDRDDEIIIPLNTAMYRVLGKRYVDFIEVQVSEGQWMNYVHTEIINVLSRRHGITNSTEELIRVRDMAEIQETIQETARTFSWLLGSIAFISLMVGGIGIMNIMLVSVTERTREIGLRKAVGANKADINLQFLIEAVSICLSGGLLGILTGWGVSLAIANFAGWSMRVTIEAIMLAFIFSAGSGIFFGIWPARKAANLKPIDALRYE
ncbi:MAG: ABC transporter permease [Elusimicrobiota bacterium]